MKTKHKIFLANLVSSVVLAGRRIFAKSNITQCRRMGITWELDLSEGVDFAVYLLGAHERSTIATYRRIVPVGGTVLDIGANVGTHTLPLADIVGSDGKVVAAEPTVFALAKLKRNLELNPGLSERVTVVHAMLGESPGGNVPNTLPSSWPLDQSGDIHPLMRSREQSTQGACMTTVDALRQSLSLGKVDFVKLDVDGFEVAVLRGARATLAECRPRIVMELAEYTLRERGFTLEELIGIFVDHGYAFYDESIRHRLPETIDALRPLMVDGASLNTVVLPPGDPMRPD